MLPVIGSSRAAAVYYATRFERDAMVTEQQSGRRRFQFRLPTIILVTALIAMAIAWWRDHRDLQRRVIEAQQQIQFLKTAPYVDGPHSTSAERVR